MKIMLDDLKDEIIKTMEKNCQACQKGGDVHDCLSLSDYSKKRLCFENAWECVDPCLKDRVIKSIAKKALFEEGMYNLLFLFFSII